MNIILFGAPGAGKGTQSSLLIERKNMFQISTGDLFRSAIKNKTDLGKRAQEFMHRGELVPDSIVIGMVEEVLRGQNKNFILDGFPRTVAQAEALDLLTSKLNIKIEKSIFIHVPKTELLGRLTGRRVCKNCGAVYHLISKPTRKAGICDACGGEVVQRPDDQESVIETRLKAYEDYTSPLKEYYRKLGKYFEVDGNKSSEEVYKNVESLLK
ncbi:MAG: adenylate kinase [Bdellovibrionota bacterium]